MELIDCKWHRKQNKRGVPTTMYEELQQWIDESRRIVFFGGAGVSTESGIPDFRSQDGLYHQQFAYPPEEILSHTFLRAIRRNFTASTARKCSPWTRSRTTRTAFWRSWKPAGV